MTDDEEREWRKARRAAGNKMFSESPCSVPRLLRIFIPIETPEQQAICKAHDDAYAHGGTRRNRAIADALFLLGMLQNGMDIDLAHQYHAAVRVCGKSHWGDGIYSDDPPATEFRSRFE